jgi:type II secretory pathway pseudopilin PulG
LNPWRAAAGGFTFVEIIVTLGIASIVGLIVLGSVGKPARAIHDYQVRVQADSQARTCMSTILNLLRSAVPGSVVISSDDADTGTATGKPNGHIRFIYRPAAQAAGTASPTYDIYLTATDPARVRMKATSPANVIVLSPQTLASNVAYLQINQSPTDTTFLDVSLKISAPMGGDQTHDVEILNQTVRVGSAP